MGYGPSLPPSFSCWKPIRNFKASGVAHPAGPRHPQRPGEAIRLLRHHGLGGIGAVLLIGLFFSRHRFFPLAFTLYAGWMVALNLTSYYLVQSTPAISERHGGSDVVALGAMLGSTALWTGYLWYSRRAKLTFTRRFYFLTVFPFSSIPWHSLLPGVSSGAGGDGLVQVCGKGRLILGADFCPQFQKQG